MIKRELHRKAKGLELSSLNVVFLFFKGILPPVRVQMTPTWLKTAAQNPPNSSFYTGVFAVCDISCIYSIFKFSLCFTFYITESPSVFAYLLYLTQLSVFTAICAALLMKLNSESERMCFWFACGKV